MGRRIAKKAAFLMLALCIQLLFGICCAVAAADTAGNSTQLSDEVMEQAMDIISAAEGAGLTEEAIGQLEALGLTESQIEMLQSLSEAESGMNASSNESWNPQTVDLKGASSVLFISLGVVIAATVIAVMCIVRWLFKLKRDSGKGEE